MTDIQELAAAELLELEDQLGHPLHAEPLHQVDQWAAGVRDVFVGLGVDLDQPDQARAAHAGAYVVWSTLYNNGSQIPWGAAIGVSHLLRHLVDRTDGTARPVPPRRRRWWRR